MQHLATVIAKVCRTLSKSKTLETMKFISPHFSQLIMSALIKRQVTYEPVEMPARKYSRKNSWSGKSKKAKKGSKVATLKMVKRMIDRTEEKKKAVYYSTLANGNSWGAGTGVQLPVTPYPTLGMVIAQGDGQADRSGNKIRTKKVLFKLNLFPYQYDVTNNPFPIPQDIRIVISSQRNNHTIAPIASNMFDTGDGFSGPTGAITDLTLPLNSASQVIYMDKIVKLAPAVGGTGTQAIFGNLTNNDYKFNQLLEFDCTKFCPAQVEWNDTSTTPTSKSVFVTIIPCNATGSASTNNFVYTYTNSIEYIYTDA